MGVLLLAEICQRAISKTSYSKEFEEPNLSTLSF